MSRRNHRLGRRPRRLLQECVHVVVAASASARDVLLRQVRIDYVLLADGQLDERAFAADARHKRVEAHTFGEAAEETKTAAAAAAAAIMAHSTTTHTQHTSASLSSPCRLCLRPAGVTVLAVGLWNALTDTAPRAQRACVHEKKRQEHIINTIMCALILHSVSTTSRQVWDGNVTKRAYPSLAMCDRCRERRCRAAPRNLQSNGGRRGLSGGGGGRRRFGSKVAPHIAAAAVGVA